MRINLYGERTDEVLVAVKDGDSLILNGEQFDFSQLGEGDTLPFGSVVCRWVPTTTTVDRINGQVIISLNLPNPWNYSPEQAFPEPLLDVQDGRLAFPPPLPDENGNYPELPPIPETTSVGVIHWERRITKAMKDAAADAEHLVLMKAELATRNAQAVAQIARIQDRIDTIGYGIDIGEATEEEEAEQAALLISIAAWKAYKFAMGKVTKQIGWPASPVWPIVPAIPVIIADPDAMQTSSA